MSPSFLTTVSLLCFISSCFLFLTYYLNHHTSLQPYILILMPFSVYLFYLLFLHGQTFVIISLLTLLRFFSSNFHKNVIPNSIPFCCFPSVLLKNVTFSARILLLLLFISVYVSVLYICVGLTEIHFITKVWSYATSLFRTDICLEDLW